MKKFECKCGNRTFFVDRNGAKAKCFACFEKYDYFGGQWSKSPSAIKKAIDFFNPRKMLEYIYRDTSKQMEETIGEFKKRVGAEKPSAFARKCESIDMIFGIGEYGKAQAQKKMRAKIRRRWKTLIDTLETGNTWTITKNDHYGSLRGQAIAKVARTELKQLGYDLQVKYKNNGAIIWLKK